MLIVIALIAFIIGSQTVYASDQYATFAWKSGLCKDAFYVYRSTDVGWVKVAETPNQSISFFIPNKQTQWRVSSICQDGENKGEWWINQGIWVGANVNQEKKKR